MLCVSIRSACVCVLGLFILKGLLGRPVKSYHLLDCCVVYLGCWGGEDPAAKKVKSTRGGWGEPKKRLQELGLLGLGLPYSPETPRKLHKARATL